MSSVIASETAVIGIVAFFAVVITLVCVAYAVHVRALAQGVKQSQDRRRRTADIDLRDGAPSTVTVHLRAVGSARRAHRTSLEHGF